jgi:hypothetical protein
MRRWILLLCAVALAIGGLIDPWPAHAGDSLSLHQSHSEQHHTMAAGPDLSLPGDIEHGPNDDGFLDGCAVGGCAFCIAGQIVTVDMSCGAWTHRRTITMEAHSRMIVPLLPPPILHA